MGVGACKGGLGWHLSPPGSIPSCRAASARPEPARHAVRTQPFPTRGTNCVAARAREYVAHACGHRLLGDLSSLALCTCWSCNPDAGPRSPVLCDDVAKLAFLACCSLPAGARASLASMCRLLCTERTERSRTFSRLWFFCRHVLSRSRILSATWRGLL